MSTQCWGFLGDVSAHEFGKSLPLGTLVGCGRAPRDVGTAVTTVKVGRYHLKTNMSIIASSATPPQRYVSGQVFITEMNVFAVRRSTSSSTMIRDRRYYLLHWALPCRLLYCALDAEATAAAALPWC